MGLQKSYEYEGFEYPDAYFRVYVTDCSNYRVKGRCDVFRTQELADGEHRRLTLYKNFIIPTDQWTTYKVDTAGLEEAGRTPQKGFYEYLKATDAFLSDAADV